MRSLYARSCTKCFNRPLNLNSSARSIWTQCPQRLSITRRALSIVVASRRPCSKLTTRSSRPWIIVVGTTASTGTVECCLRARVSDSCFTPPSPKHAPAQAETQLKGWCVMDVVHPRCAGSDCSRKDAKVCVGIQGQGRRAKSATVTTWGRYDQPDPGATRAFSRRESQLCGDRVHQRLLETVLLPARRRTRRDPGQRQGGAQRAGAQNRSPMPPGSPTWGTGHNQFGAISVCQSSRLRHTTSLGIGPAYIQCRKYSGS